MPKRKQLIIAVDRRGSNNPKWRGGICSIKNLNEVLTLPNTTKKNLENKIQNNKHIQNRTRCWIWTGSYFIIRKKQIDTGRRLPSVCVGDKRVLASRLSYVLFNGVIPNGLKVCHTCDNPSCVNPKHLWLGTNQDNSDDMVQKGRSLTGSKNPDAKLTEKQVVTILKRFKAGELRSNLAREYNVSWTTIDYLIKGKSWATVTGLTNAKKKKT